MKITGETIIAAARADVWSALMDPDILSRCIDGVEKLERTEGQEDEEGRFIGTMNAKVGPVRAKFTGEVAITDAQAPAHYVLVGEGKGGVAGFAKGSAAVDLAELGETETRLSYEANSQVGGKLAQLGARLVEGAAKGYAERFFTTFKDIVEARADETGAVEAGPDNRAGAAPAATGAGSHGASTAAPISAAPQSAGTPAGAIAASEPTIGAVNENEPFRSARSGLGAKGWGMIVIAFAAAIVAAQFL